MSPSAQAKLSVQKLAEGVYAVIRKEPPGLMVDANNVFIINDGDVVVVDSNGDLKGLITVKDIQKAIKYPNASPAPPRTSSDTASHP